jgi:hypothetical protein
MVGERGRDTAAAWPTPVPNPHRLTFVVADVADRTLLVLKPET